MSRRGPPSTTNPVPVAVTLFVTQATSVVSSYRGSIALMEIQTEADFERTLVDAVREALENGVEVEGGWDCSVDGSTEFGVEIFRVERDSEDAAAGDGGRTGRN